MDISSLLALVPPADIAYVTAFVGVCAIIASNVTPPKNPKSVLGRVYGVINFIGNLPLHAKAPGLKAIRDARTPTVNQ